MIQQFQFGYLKKTKTVTQKDVCTPMFTAALFTIAKIWKKPTCPINGWVCVWVCVYVHMCACIGILFSYKIERNLAIYNMDRSWGHYAIWNKSDRDYHIISLTRGIQNKTKPKLIDTENRLVVVRGKEWVKAVKRVKRNKLPVIK